MKKILSIILFFWLTSQGLLAQDNCPLYDTYINKGNKLMQANQLTDALNAYLAAQIHCPSRAEEAQKKIKLVFDRINHQKVEIENKKNEIERQKNRAERAKQSAINMVEALAGKQENYYRYFYKLGKTAYDLGEYDEAVGKLTLASESFDKPDGVNIQPLIRKAHRCQVSQDKAYALIKAKKYEEAEQQIAITYNINPKARKTALIAAALNPAKYGIIKVQGGTFQMGSISSEEKDEMPVHSVQLDDFSMGTYEVTNLAYAIFMNRYGSSRIKKGAFIGKILVENTANGITQQEDGSWTVGKPENDFAPVIYVSWYGANEFCNYYGGHLPTEAEWEYAAKGGQNTKAYRYAGSNNVNEVAWYDKNAGNTNGVGLKKANELGLYDMSGNVWEWCWDIYQKDAYSQTPKTIQNPLFLYVNDNTLIIDKNEFTDKYYTENSKNECVLRGGAWIGQDFAQLTANRNKNTANFRFKFIGFRFAK